MNTKAMVGIAVSTLALGFVTWRTLGTTPVQASEARAAASEPAQSAEAQRAEQVARGKYLVSTAGCHDCHTPWKMGAAGPEPDMSKALSGHPEGMQLPPPPAPSGPWIVSIAATNTAYAGPWGTSFTANLTPDRETGLGTWTKDNFIQTIRKGKRMGSGRALLPPMPYPVYSNMTDGDLEAMYWYLQSLPPMKNRVPQPLPPAAG